MAKTPRSILTLSAILGLLAGCGDEGGDDAKGPSREQVLLVQRSAAAVDAVSQATEAGNQAILTSSSDSSAPGPHAVPVFPGATPAFDFAANVDMIVDLDALDPDGNDRFPNATGQIHVTATGTQTGAPEAGDATFSATIAFETDVIVNNSESGAVATIPAGASWSYLLEVTWTQTDDSNWSVTATATTTINVVDLIVVDGATTLTVDIQGEREVISSFTRVAGKLSHERSFSGSLTTTVDNGSTTETVTFAFVKPGKVRITVLGHVFGPMSGEQFGQLFNTIIP